MSDDFGGGEIKAGVTDAQVPVLFRLSADNTAKDGLAAANVSCSFFREGEALPVSALLSAKSHLSAANMQGGFMEISAATMPGLYICDLPSAITSAGAKWALVSFRAAACYEFAQHYALVTDDDTLLTRLTATRASYLDLLNSGVAVSAGVTVSAHPGVVLSAAQQISAYGGIADVVLSAGQQISAWTPQLAGANSCVFTQQQSDTTAVSDVRVWLTSDSGGATVVAGYQLTNASGQATFNLDDGTYYAWRYKAGQLFGTNPETWTVSGATNLTLTDASDATTGSGIQFSDLYNEYIQFMGWNTGQSDDVTRAKRHINWAVRQICAVRFWKFRQEMDTFATVADTKSYSLPSDIGDNPNALAGLVDTTSDKVIKRLSRDQLVHMVPDWSNTGNPEQYMTWEDQIYLRPIPDKAYTIRRYYWRNFADMSADTDEPGDGRFYEDFRPMIVLAAVAWYGRMGADDPLRMQIVGDVARRMDEMKSVDDMTGDYLPGFSEALPPVVATFDPLGDT